MISNELLEMLSVITKEEESILKGNEVDLKLYTDSKANVVDAGKLLENGKLIQIRPHTRFVHFPEHTHNYIEVIYMCKGSTTHIINGDKLELTEGEILFLNQNARQEILPAKKDDIAVNFIVLPQFFDEALELMGVEDNPIRSFLLGAMLGKDDTGYLHFRVSDILPIQNLVENLIWSLSNEQPSKRSVNKITMGLLILELMDHADRVNVGNKSVDNDVLLKVFKYIDDNYVDGELGILAENLKMTDYNLSRFINKNTGKNFTELIQEKRLSQAAYLLRTTGLSINDISAYVGYDNSSYFYRLFKEKFSMSPRDYRIKD